MTYTTKQLQDLCETEKGFRPSLRSIYQILRSLNYPKVGYREEYKLPEKIALVIIERLKGTSGRRPLK